MKVVFIQKDSFAKISIAQLAAVLNDAGHDCDLCIGSNQRKLIESALNSGAGLFAFSCTTGEEGWVSATAAELCKGSSAPIIVGGPHTTFFPQFIEDPSIDYICRGEGEGALPDLVNARAEGLDSVGRIPNIWAKETSGEIKSMDVRPFIEDLDSLPMPDFSIYGKYKYLLPYHRNMFPIITSRGCPYNCSYCFNRRYKEIYANKGKYIRRRSPHNVIEELLHGKESFGITQVNFVDDSFFCSPNWLREFAELYKEKIGLPFIINVEASQVCEELIRLVKEMGCICTRMGVESGNNHLRQTVLNKKVTTEQIRAAAEHIKSHGIKLVTYNILGLPGETVDNAIETYRLNREIHADFAQCTLLQPYPGTAIREFVRERGLLKEEPLLQASSFVSSSIKLESEKEITNLQKLMQVFMQMHVPMFLIRAIIKLPKNPLFNFIFKLSFIYNKIKTQRTRLFPVFILGLHSFSYMRERKRR